MKSSILLLAAAVAIGATSPPASAAVSPKTLLIAGAGLAAGIATLVYSNERGHHAADVQRDAAIQEALLEHNARLEGEVSAQRAPITVNVTTPSTFRSPDYECIHVDLDGICTTFALQR